MDEAKIPHLDTKIITVTEVKMSADLKVPGFTSFL